MTYPISRARTVALFCSLAIVLISSGCTVQFVSRYDETTEKSITTIQRDVERLFQEIERSLGTPEARYENYVAVYEQLQIEATMLNTRAQAIDMNSITTEQSEQLIGWLNNLQRLHRTGIPAVDVLAVTRQQARQIFVAMLKFELAKKRQSDTVIVDGR